MISFEFLPPAALQNNYLIWLLPSALGSASLEVRITQCSCSSPVSGGDGGGWGAGLGRLPARERAVQPSLLPQVDESFLSTLYRPPLQDTSWHCCLVQ